MEAAFFFDNCRTVIGSTTILVGKVYEETEVRRLKSEENYC